MTYAAKIQRIAERAEYQPAVFPLPVQTGWSSIFPVEQVLLLSPPFRTPSSGSSIVLPAFSEVTNIWQEIEASTVRRFEFQVRWVKQLYSFKKPEEVFRYLQAHPFLIPLLVEAHSRIEDYFGPQPQVVLEVVSDPEVHGLVKMFGYIVTTLMPEEAGQRLRLFDREWFLLQVHRAEGLLNFDVEFR
ncbi:MAG: hypothetical protein AB1566_08450 [Chloroflexota bacterium]